MWGKRKLMTQMAQMIQMTQTLVHAALNATSSIKSTFLHQPLDSTGTTSNTLPGIFSCSSRGWRGSIAAGVMSYGAFSEYPKCPSRVTSPESSVPDVRGFFGEIGDGGRGHLRDVVNTSDYRRGPGDDKTFSY